MKRYVLGFFLTPKGAVLIRKARRWGGYVWNGIGGKIEEGETPVYAMVREFAEEAGVVTNIDHWTQLFTLSGLEYGDAAKPWEMTIFMAHTDDVGLFAHLPHEIDEGYVDLVMDTYPDQLDSTAGWLLPMCDDLHFHDITLTADERTVVAAFYQRVCDRAEQNMAMTGTVSGAHWNAMRQELGAMGIAVAR